jgi:hypothetical protein
MLVQTKKIEEEYEVFTIDLCLLITSKESQVVKTVDLLKMTNFLVDRNFKLMILRTIELSEC